MFKQIILDTEISKLSQKTVKSAIELTARFNAEMIAVKVIPRNVHTYFEGSFTVADSSPKKRGFTFFN